MTKVFQVLTDNGSNIVAACNILEELLEDGEDYEEEKDEEEDESIMDIEEESQSLFDTDVDDTNEEDFDWYRDSQDAAEEIEAYDKCENDVSVVFAGWKRLPLQNLGLRLWHWSIAKISRLNIAWHHCQ